LFEHDLFGKPVSTFPDHALIQKEGRMSRPDLRDEIYHSEVEPLLPVEKKLIGWSLGLGIALLVVLIAVNHFVPIKL
jgi:hypothetical protein